MLQGWKVSFWYIFFTVSLFKYCFLESNQTVSGLSVRFTRHSKINKTSESLTAFLINIRSKNWGELERKGKCNVTLKRQHEPLKKNQLNQYRSPQEFNRGLLKNLLKKSRFVQFIAQCRYVKFLQSQKLWNFYYNQKIQEINKCRWLKTTKLISQLKYEHEGFWCFLFLRAGHKNVGVLCEVMLCREHSMHLDVIWTFSCQQQPSDFRNRNVHWMNGDTSTKNVIVFLIASGLVLPHKQSISAADCRRLSVQSLQVILWCHRANVWLVETSL